MGEGQICRMKRDLDAHLSSPRIWKRGWKQAVQFWWASWNSPIRFATCPLRDCHSSTPIQKVCAIWVPRIFTDEHKQKCMDAALSFLERYHREGDEFLGHIATGDETWISLCVQESKRHSQEWHHVHSPTKASKIQVDTLNCKQNHRQRFSGTGKAFIWLTSCPVERSLMQAHIAQHWRVYGVLPVFKTAVGAYLLAECVCFMTTHDHTLQKIRAK
jgi:hypothetical protein